MGNICKIMLFNAFYHNQYYRYHQYFINLHFIIINIIGTANIFDDGQYLQNIIVQFALSAICGRPPDQGKQDVRTILTREHDKIAAEY